MIENIDITGFLTVKVRRWDEVLAGYRDWETICENKRNLLTNAGRDFFHTSLYTSITSGGAGFNWIGLTTDSTAPAAGDTSLASEITTGGLARAQSSTRTHTGGTNTSQFVNTWTATSSFTAVQKAATFKDAAAGQTMGHENTFASTNLNVNDQIQLTWTFTLG